MGTVTPIDPELAELQAIRRAEEDAGHAARKEQASTWAEVDLADILAGDLEPEQPVVFRRTDGLALLYPGKTHSLVGEFESGKSWAAAAAVAETALTGKNVLYVDFEDSPKTLARRLVALGVPAEVILRFVHYIGPSKSLDAPGAKLAFYGVGVQYKPALVILDGVTEAMALHNWNPNEMTDVAKFLDAMPRRWDRTGAAVVLIDHVVKSKDDRGRYAIGSQHKMSGVNGASYKFVPVGSLSPGRHGKVNIEVLKDREGTVRAFAGDGRQVGTMHLQPAPDRGPGALDITVEPPSYTEERDQHETLKAAVAAWLAEQAEPVSQTAVETADDLVGDVRDIRAALAALVEDGYVERTNGPRRSKLHRLVRPFAVTE